MGSEMCIRDRVTAPSNAAVDLLTALVHAAGISVLRLGHLSRIDPCLLYTSDAADERSSVDLGGRRIIKQKTTSRT